MRVLSVGNGYPPHHHGGYELVWQSAVRYLEERGHEVAILTIEDRTDDGDEDPALEERVSRSLRWHLEGSQFRKLGLRARAAMARHNHAELEAQLDAFRPDIVAWWGMGGLTLTLLETVRRRGVPAVAFVHDEWLEYGQWADPWLELFTGPRRGRLAPIAERLVGLPTKVDFANAAHYVFVSEFTREHASGLGLGLASTAVANSGIDPAFLDPAPTHDEWHWRLLCVGRIDRRKGIDTAISALAHLPLEAQLVVAGSWDAEEEVRLRREAEHLYGEGRVHFVGKLGRGELMAAYRDCDAVVFPVRWNEPWGLVPIEAMAMGRPVVATGRGGSAEYLRDGENCLLFEAEDERGLAAALERLAGSEELRATLRAEGIKTAPLHTEERFNREVEKALLGALEERRPGARG